MSLHQSVLYRETLEQLLIKPDGIYLDCTFGRGGHCSGILSELNDKGRLLALDRDPDAIHSAEAKQLQKDKRFSLHHESFANLDSVLNTFGYMGQINGILMDLGVSSPQLDNGERGFSFLREGPLDMRMDTTQKLSAKDYLAQVEEKTLAKVLFEYGEERFSRQIAHAIVDRRQSEPLETTQELVKLIEDTVPFREKHKHPATRTFQALRIEINQELQEIEKALQQSLKALGAGGRLVVISFHSLEDRIVKRFIRHESGRKFNPGRLPLKEQDIAKGELTKIGKSIRADQDELARNPRARSAIMRVAEKIK
jgi:16S rRNA (cytosine1402-N4)-methyltransferase